MQFVEQWMQHEIIILRKVRQSQKREMSCLDCGLLLLLCVLFMFVCFSIYEPQTLQIHKSIPVQMAQKQKQIKGELMRRKEVIGQGKGLWGHIGSQYITNMHKGDFMQSYIRSKGRKYYIAHSFGGSSPIGLYSVQL